MGQITKDILVVILFLIIGFWVYNNIIYPSHLSYKYACFQERTMIEHPDLVVLGQVSVRTNETGEDIIIKELFFDDIGTRKHEHCHEVQYHQNRLYTSCRTPVKVFNELECYSSEYLPDIVYNLIYGNP